MAPHPSERPEVTDTKAREADLTKTVELQSS